MNEQWQKLWDKFEKHHEVILSLALLSFLLPLIALCYYAMPSQDDFQFAYKTLSNGYWNSVKDWYINWTGRYSLCMIMSVNPLVWKSVAGCKIAYLILIVWTPIAFGHLYLQLFLSKKAALFYSAISTFFYFLLIPSINESVFWMSGAFSYQFPNLLFLHFISLLLSVYFQKRLSIPAIVVGMVLIFFLAGTNETMMLYTLFVSLVFLFFSYTHQKKTWPAWCFVLLAIVCAAIVIMAPGNNNRQELFPNRENLYYAIKFYILGTGFYSMHWLIFPTIFLGLFFLRNDQLRFTIKPINKWLLFLLTCSYTLGIALPAWAIGELPNPRLFSCVLLTFMLCMILFILQRVPNQNVTIAESIRKKGILLLTLIAIAFAVGSRSSNYYIAAQELVNGKAKKYDDVNEKLLNSTSPLVLSPADIEALTGSAMLGQQVITLKDMQSYLTLRNK